MKRLIKQEIEFTRKDIDELEYEHLPNMAKNELAFAENSDYSSIHLKNAYWMLYRYLVAKSLVPLRKP